MRRGKITSSSAETLRQQGVDGLPEGQTDSMGATLGELRRRVAELESQRSELTLNNRQLCTLNLDLNQSLANQGPESPGSAEDRLRKAGDNYPVSLADRRKTERANRDAERRLRAILHAAPDAIVVLDQRGDIQEVNTATVRMFGYSSAELCGRNIRQLMQHSPGPGQKDSIVSYLASCAVEQRAHRCEEVACRKDGSLFPVRLSFSQLSPLGWFVGFVQDISPRHDLQKQLLEIVAEEDRRIGTELHDNIQQQLTGMGLLAAHLVDVLRPQANLEAELAARLAGAINQCAQEVHSLARGLVSMEIDARDLQAALASLAETVREQCGVACAFHCQGTAEVSDNVVATHLYRIAQEAVNNAIKHGRADRVQIALKREEQLTLEVSDNGEGMVAKRDPSMGMGLRIMKYRAGLIGGRLQIQAGRERGTVVSCCVAQPSGEAGR
ncbi:MAG: PAS domain S-box protein [Planctomycetales bacterium]|nr:PAS domain S-box protein [Planctomycetales bacterium]